MSIKIYVKYVKNNRDFHTTKLNLPTGALDTASGLAVMKLFRELVEQEHITVVMTTHDQNLMELGDFVYELKDGRLVK